MKRFTTNCEHNISTPCGKPSVFRYPAWGGGYFYLCAEHGEKHRSISQHVDGTLGALVNNGFERYFDRVPMPIYEDGASCA